MIPKLRFPEFRDEWQQKRLGDLDIYVSDGNYGEMYPKSAEMIASGVPFIRANNIKDSRLVWDDMKFISPELHSTLTSGHLEVKDILITTRGDIGSIAYVTDDFSGSNINAQICLLRVAPKISSEFIFQYLGSKKGRTQFRQLQTGSALKQLPKGKLALVKVRLPSREEQRKIADFLTAVDEKVTAIRKKKELLEQYKKGAMQAIFLPAGEEGSQRIRFLPGSGWNYPDWQERTLDELNEFSKGSALLKDDLSDTGKYEAIHYGELFTDYNEVVTRIYSHSDMISQTTTAVGDILMPSSDVTPQGLATASSIQREGVVVGGDINILRPNRTKVDSRFLSYLLNFEKDKIIQVVSGTTVRHIYASDLKKLRYKIPIDIEEQQKIVDFLMLLDERIELEAKKLEQAKRFKKSLLQQMFV